jgi:serine/threonine protein kinase
MESASRNREISSEMGKYHLIAELARGGMGNVYLAVLCRPGGFNKLLVLKELKPELSADETYVTMFLEEARLAARLIHPNIVQTNEVHSENHSHYMTMEYLDGRSLYRIVRRFGREGSFPVGARLRVISEALLGLHYAHELLGFDGEPLGIVHRDVSPLNVMVTFDGQAKVLDFGIAKAVDSSLETKTGVLKGRVAYMSPEQVVGAKVDRRADVYSMGVMIWEAAAGRRLWPEMSEVEILSRVLREGPPRLRDVVPDAPADLDAICARAMAQDCDQRYPTAAALHDDVEAHLAERDDRMTMRQVGDIVRAMFADERQRTSQVIEETIARVGTGPRSGVMATLRTETGATPSGPFMYAESGASRVIAQLPNGRSVIPPMPNEGPSKSSLRGGPFTASQSANGAVEPLIVAHRGANPKVVAGIAGAVLLLVAVGAAWTLGREATRSADSARGEDGKTAGNGNSSLTIHTGSPENLIGRGAQLSAPKAPATAMANTGNTAPSVGEPHETATTAVLQPRTHWVGGSNAAAAKTRPSPALAASAPEPRRTVSAGAASPEKQPSCDPPYTVDSSGIEHFKAGCL